MPPKTLLLKRLAVELDLLLCPDCAPVENIKTAALTLKGKIDNYDWVGFYQLQPEKNSLKLINYVGSTPKYNTVVENDGIYGKVFATKKTIVSNKIDKENDIHLSAPNIQSVIALPVFKNNEFYGIFCINSTDKSAFEECDINFLKHLCKKIEENI